MKFTSIELLLLPVISPCDLFNTSTSRGSFGPDDDDVSKFRSFANAFLPSNGNAWKWVIINKFMVG